MKTSPLIVALIFAVASANTQAQTALESVGVGTPGSYTPSPTPEQIPAWEQQFRESMESAETKAKEANLHLKPGDSIFRKVNGQTYNIIMSKLWKNISGKVYTSKDGVLILMKDVYSKSYDAGGWHESYNTVYTAIKNYSGNPVNNDSLTVIAMRIGNYNMGGIPIALWDCGLPSTPPPLTPEQIAAKKAKIALDQQKVLEGQTNAVYWLYPQATNGDASAQFSLGEHYLNGQGCETNKEQAIYWLQKSAAQGDIEASNKMVSLTIKPLTVRTTTSSTAIRVP